MIGMADNSCVHLLFAGLASLPDTVTNQIGSRFEVDLAAKRRVLAFRERAAVDRRVEHLHVRVAGQSNEPSSYEIEFHYDADALLRRARTTQRELVKSTALLGVLAALPREVEFECSASFEYGPKSAQGLFPVRLGTAQGSDRAFDEVRGLTTVKLEDGGVSYTVALESLDLETLSLYVEFKRAERFSSGLPAAILERAVTIASGFI